MPWCASSVEHAAASVTEYHRNRVDQSKRELKRALQNRPVLR
jgi:hypothetical protein